MSKTFIYAETNNLNFFCDTKIDNRLENLKLRFIKIFSGFLSFIVCIDEKKILDNALYSYRISLK